jgi:hypothetical protein
MVRGSWHWALVCTLVLAGAWWFWQVSSSRGGQTAPDAPRGVNDGAAAPATAQDTSSAGSAAASRTFQSVLLPDGVIGARADSVRIGLGQISAEDARTYDEWVQGGRQGAGPAERSELATVERWQPVPAIKRADAKVDVGPLALPWADRYDLMARGDDGLHFYLASFTSDAYPATVTPTIAAGLRVFFEAEPGVDVRVLLRRSGNADDAANWQELLAREAPPLLAAMNESALAIAPGQVLAPLPPGALEVILVVAGVESQRHTVALAAGTVAVLRFDAVAVEVARTLSVDLELTFVVDGTRAPVRELGVTLGGEEGEQSRTTDGDGRVLFTGLDRQQRAALNLVFPKSDGVLPMWPSQRAIEVDLEKLELEQPPATQLLRKTIDLRPLQWLHVRTGAFPLSLERRVGNPFPIFVLQQERDGQWIDAAAEFFLPVPEGLAVSIEAPGKFRLAAVRSPWSVLYSTAADNRVRSADGRYQADLLTDPGRAVELTLLHAGQPLGNAPVDVRGPIRGLPDSNLTTDANGHLQLDGVTEPRLRVEVPGFVVAEVAVLSTLTRVELQREREP